jgi:hypothetical protein
MPVDSCEEAPSAAQSIDVPGTYNEALYLSPFHPQVGRGLDKEVVLPALRGPFSSSKHSLLLS